MHTIACIVGTRPEVIKMAPIIFQLKKMPWANVVVINTAQHRQLLDGMLEVFDIQPDFDLDIMTPNQSLGELTANLCHKLNDLMTAQKFDAILAAGDTTTVLVAALISFYHHIPFGHVEAGLRTYNHHEPFPEEINRVLAAPVSTWHFAPTALEKENLLRENIRSENITVTGNPVIDALHWVLANKDAPSKYQHLHNVLLVTAHRRENFGQNMENICEAILILAQRFPHLNIVIPVHPNPQVQGLIEASLGGHKHIHLLPPLKYDEFAHLLQRAIMVLTDSGGIQEEAPALGKPVLVLRNTTERPAIISEGVGILVGTDTETIVSKASQLLTNEALYESMAHGVSPYGDGHAAERIVAVLAKYFEG